MRQVVQWNKRNLVGVDVRTGKQLWPFVLPHEGVNQNMPTPTFIEGSILLGAENRGTRSISSRRKGDRWSFSEERFWKDAAFEMSTGVTNEDLSSGHACNLAGAKLTL